MKREELQQDILKQESFIEEEQRCLNFCLSNPDECEEGEIKEREEYIGELIEKLKHTNGLLNIYPEFLPAKKIQSPNIYPEFLPAKKKFNNFCRQKKFNPQIYPEFLPAKKKIQ